MRHIKACLLAIDHNVINSSLGDVMSGWGCPHEVNGVCQKVLQRKCDPGMKGCVLAGRFIFSDTRKNTQAIEKRKVKNTKE